MRELTVGKARGLQQLANCTGVFKICAVDHRRSLRRVIDAQNPSAVDSQALLDFKMDICKTLIPHTESVLLDPIYGASQAIASNAISGKTGLLVSLNIADNDDAQDSDERQAEFLIDWNVDKVRSLGASAVKVPLYYRPDLPNLASEQYSSITKIAYDCKKADIALFVEPKNYIVPELEKDQWEWARKKPDLIIATARQISSLPVDVLKMEFPSDISYEQDKEKLFHLCQQLDDACQVPWVLLSGGVDFNVFAWQLEIACKAGASGFLAGRTLWQEAAAMPSRWDRVKFLETTATDRLNQLIAIADCYGMPWFKKLEASNNYILPDFATDWSRTVTGASVHRDVSQPTSLNA